LLSGGASTLLFRAFAGKFRKGPTYLTKLSVKWTYQANYEESFRSD
jgi:hypothetical protein